MFSWPAPTVTCMPSTMICLAAMAIAIRPEAHWRSMVWPLTDNGKPAAKADRRARLVAAVPLCMAVPSTRSSISPGSMAARSTAARIATALIDGDLKSLNAPRKALAMGVRAVETITASCMVLRSNDQSQRRQRAARWG
ncbi:hypothetical protein D3C76_1311320 [compost metagenome]